jgi:TolA-binding protein
MGNSLDRHELKKPDAALSVMTEIVEALIAFKWVVAGVVGLGVAVAVVAITYQQREQKAKEKVEAEVFRLRHEYRAKLTAKEKELTDLAAKSKDKKPDAALKAQQEAFQKEAREGYIKSLKGVVESHSKDDISVPQMELVQLYEDAKDWSAMETHSAAVRNRAKRGLIFTAASMSLGRALENQNKWADALRIYQDVNLEKEGFPPSLFKMSQARCLVRLGQAEEAKKIYSEIEKKPDDPFATEARGLRRLLLKGEKS